MSSPKDEAIPIPPNRPSFAVSLLRDEQWEVGRAGMLYRDLIADRSGGRFIASHIRILEGGTVDDWVHYHAVRFQVIYCWRGWIGVVYEDQGEPFVLREGDCVLQPPRIRHRVLECAPDSQVVEVGCPADYETSADEVMALPTPVARPEREFAGQRFVRHEAATARWVPLPGPSTGFEVRDTGIAAATGGVASARVIRRCGSSDSLGRRLDGELNFAFVLRGAATLPREGEAAIALAPGDAFALPPRRQHVLQACSRDLQVLEVSAPVSGGLK